MVKISHHPSPNCEARPAGVSIDTVILHYTGMQSAAAALARLCDAKAKVSAHYLIGEDGAIAALVAEDERAWHAGVSSWKGESNINDRSIGIELVNPGHEFGYRAFPPAQMTALMALLKDIMARRHIARERVLGHSDVAPLRKQDPGELFDWAGLAREGIGLWPRAPKTTVLDDAAAQSALARIGYEKGKNEEEKRLVVQAFQRHFRPAKVDGVLDKETMGLIAGLA